MEYDRRRSLKETLLEEIIEACVETGDAARMIRASMAHPPAVAEADPWERQAGEVLAAVLHGDVAGVRRAWPKLLDVLDKQPLLYVALGRGGNPQRIVASRGLQYVLRRLLICLPRLGLLSEACRLLETAQRMEAGHPVGPGAITEFDRVFEIGCQAITQCLVVSSAAWGGKKKAAPAAAAHRQERRPHFGSVLVLPPRRRAVDRLPGASDRRAVALLAHAQPRRAALGVGDGWRSACAGAA